MKKSKKRKSQTSAKDKEVDYFYEYLLGASCSDVFKKIKSYLKLDTMLLAMAGAPLVDGVYISWLSNGLMASASDAVICGTAILSGGGCIGAIINSRGSIREKSRTIFTVYFIILISSICVGFLSPVFISAAPKNLSVLTSIFLIALGIKISGVKKAERVFGVNPNSAIRILIFTFFINSIRSRPTLAICEDTELFLNIFISVLSGFTLTYMGLFLSKITKLYHEFNYAYLKIGQAGSLILVGLKIILPVFPTWLALLPLISGFIMGFIKIVIDSKKDSGRGKNEDK